MKILTTLTLVALLSITSLFCQSPYLFEMKNFRADYMAKHEVVAQKDKKYFRFFPVNSSYRLPAKFEKLNDTAGFAMKTSGGIMKQYYKYGRASFQLNNTAHSLFIYQSKELLKNEQYKDYLFIPFTDLSSGDESYGGGRYLDFLISDFQNGAFVIDFNKAYNPYCAYATGFHCPIPPRENFLPANIPAGEKVFGKSIH